MFSHIFVICAYKESEFLEECILSLKNQTCASKTIIVTSTPNNYIRRMADQYQLPLYINDGESGITQDWNFGYSYASQKLGCKYITIAHQDDIYEPDYLENVKEEVRRTKTPLIFFSDYYEIRKGKQIKHNKILQIKRLLLLPLRIKMLQQSRWIRRRILSMGSPICCPSVTFVVDNLPDPIFQNHYRACEDWEAWERISKLKGTFLYSKKMLMGHRIHEESETTASIVDNVRTKEEYEMFCKFWPRKIADILIKIYSKGQESNQL